MEERERHRYGTWEEEFCYDIAGENIKNKVFLNTKVPVTAGARTIYGIRNTSWCERGGKQGHDIRMCPKDVNSHSHGGWQPRRQGQLTFQTGKFHGVQGSADTAIVKLRHKVEDKRYQTSDIRRGNDGRSANNERNRNNNVERCKWCDR